MRSGSILARAVALAVCAMLLIAQAGCFASGRVTLATLDSPESILVGEIIALQLEDFGFEVVRGHRYQSVADLEAGMRAGEFDLTALFIQDALTGFGVINESPLFDQILVEEIVNNTIRDMFGYMLLDQWNLLGARYTIAMRDVEQGRRLGFDVLSRYAPSLSIAVTSGFLEGTGGLAHMREIFGELEFSDITVINATDIYNMGWLDVDVIALREYMMGSWLLDAGYAPIDSGISIWPNNILYPIAKEDVIERRPEIRAVLSSTAFHIDTAMFAERLHAISQGRQTTTEAAYEILQARNRF